MDVKHAVETPDGRVVFQGSLSGQELAFVIEMGMDAIIQAGAIPFVSKDEHAPHDLHGVPDASQ